MTVEHFMNPILTGAEGRALPLAAILEDAKRALPGFAFFRSRRRASNIAVRFRIPIARRVPLSASERQRAVILAAS